jgi:hypothetical protein
MLFVVGAEAAVVGASPFDGSVVDLWHLRRLDEDFAAAAVIVDVIGNEDALGAVLGAAFEQVDAAILKNGFSFGFAVAGGADGKSDVIEEVWASLRHEWFVGKIRDSDLFARSTCTRRQRLQVILEPPHRTTIAPLS